MTTGYLVGNAVAFAIIIIVDGVLLYRRDRRAAALVTISFLVTWIPMTASHLLAGN